jgi:ATP-dependent RNA helicase RhlE
LLFTKSKKVADLVFEEMGSEENKNFGVIHSNKSQNFRFSSLNNFQDGTSKVLIATDLVSRGLDISDVTHVINFDLPDESPNYIHRIGRTGRADKDGIAISFITSSDEKMLIEIEEMMKMKISEVDFPENVEISDVLIEMEMPVLPGVNYMPDVKIDNSKGAFHEKKKKNSKVNLGGSYKRKIKEKYKKNQTRGQKKK